MSRAGLGMENRGRVDTEALGARWARESQELIGPIPAHSAPRGSELTAAGWRADTKQGLTRTEGVPEAAETARHRDRRRLLNARASSVVRLALGRSGLAYLGSSATSEQQPACALMENVGRVDAGHEGTVTLLSQPLSISCRFTAVVLSNDEAVAEPGSAQLLESPRAGDLRSISPLISSSSVEAVTRATSPAWSRNSALPRLTTTLRYPLSTRARTRFRNSGAVHRSTSPTRLR